MVRKLMLLRIEYLTSKILSGKKINVEENISYQAQNHTVRYVGKKLNILPPKSVRYEMLKRTLLTKHRNTR